MAMDCTAALPNRRKDTGPASQPTGSCLPLSMVRTGETVRVGSIRGNDDTKRFLRNLGLVEDARVTVVCERAGNVIVQVKGTRIAVSKAMAGRILIVLQEEGTT